MHHGNMQSQLARQNAFEPMKRCRTQKQLGEGLMKEEEFLPIFVEPGFYQPASTEYDSVAQPLEDNYMAAERFAPN